MLILGLDYETTGLDPETKQVIEVGLQLWDWDLGVPVNEMGYIVNHENLIWDEGFEQKSKVTTDMCRKYGISSKNGLKRIHIMIQSADYMCAQNGGAFDRLFYQSWCRREGLPDPRPEMVWIDTNLDIEIPEGNSRRLAYMAADHGLCPHNAHRALADVDQMMNILKKHDINRAIESAKTPTITIEALVRYDDREKAKVLGYHAEYDNGKFKFWIKTIKQFSLEAERQRASGSFDVRILDNYKRK